MQTPIQEEKSHEIRLQEYLYMFPLFEKLTKTLLFQMASTDFQKFFLYLIKVLKRKNLYYFVFFLAE